LPSKSRKSSTKQETELVPDQAPTQQELTPEQRKFLDTMNNLIMSAQELSYAVALLPNELIEKHPELKELIDSAKNVVRATWQLHKLIKSRMSR